MKSNSDDMKYSGEVSGIGWGGGCSAEKRDFSLTLMGVHTERQRQGHQCKSMVTLQNRLPPIFKHHNAFQWIQSAADAPARCVHTLRQK